MRAMSLRVTFGWPQRVVVKVVVAFTLCLGLLTIISSPFAAMAAGAAHSTRRPLVLHGRHVTIHPHKLPAVRSPRPSVAFMAGDILAAVGGGQIEHFSAIGQLIEVLNSNITDTYNAGMCFDSSGNLYVTDFDAQTLSKFDGSGNLLQSSWGSGYNSDPESCVFDGAGHIYVGQADGAAQILEFDTSGNLLASFTPSPQSRGTDWITLASDGCTIYYTSEGSSVLRFNVCTNTQLSDFADGLTGPCFALRIRSDGEVMVACASTLYRLSSAGAVLQSYPAADYGNPYLFAMNLDPDGTSVWTGDLYTGTIYKIDIASGNLLTSFVGGVNTALGGLAIIGESAAQIPQGPTGSERYGTGNPSEMACGCTSAEPVDDYSGNFTHTLNDISIPGRGLSLNLSHTYNAGAASVNGSLGYGWTDSYNWQLALDSGTGAATITQENGSTVTFASDGAGGFVPPSRVLATLVKNGDGSYTYTRLQDLTRFQFNASSQLISETDRNGYTTTLSYNGSGQLTTVTDPASRSLTLSYDGSGHIISVVDPGGRSVAFTYDGVGNLSSSTDVNGGVTKFTYDLNHLLLTLTDPRGGVTTNTYNGSGQVTAQSDPLGRTTRFSYAYSSDGLSQTTMTDPNGNVTVEYYYNGLLVTRTQGNGSPQQASWSYTYDPISLGVTDASDPNHHETSQTWDARGNLLSKTDPLGRTTSYTYDALNDVLTVTDPSGVTTINTYDAHGNLLTTSTPLVGSGSSQTMTYTYGDASHPGDVTTITDPNGKIWHDSYDAYGNLTSSADPLGDTTTSAYNVLGERTSQTNALGATTHTTYDPFGDLVSVTDPLGHVTAYQYDGDRNQTQVTDANGDVTKNTYDLDNELTATTRADGSVLTYSYDANGNQTAQTDELGHTTTYVYDPLNQMISLTDPLNRTTKYAYDAAGNEITRSAADSLTTTYTYDAANELGGVSYSDGTTPSVSYGYDVDGRRVSMTDGTGATSYVYDSLGRLTSATDGAGNTVGYGYDLAGHITSLMYPNSAGTVTRGYDAAGRLTSVTDWLGHTSKFSYDKAGELTRAVYGDQVVSDLRYDRAGQLLSLGYAYEPCPNPLCGTAIYPLLSFTYTHDPAGLLSTATTTQQFTAQPQQTYGYTSRNQLASVTPAGGSAVGYTYDKAGEPTRLGAATLTADAASEVTKLTQGGTSTTYSYDLRGDRTQIAVSGGATVNYSYNGANQLTSVTGVSAGTTTYAYNGDGLRMSKTVGANSPEPFVWDVAEGLPLLLVDGATSFISGPNGLPLEQITGTTPLYYLHDQLGSTRGLVDSTGRTLAATFTYDVYGATTATTGTATTPLRFAGQYLDSETGLYYLRARYYDPATAQFMTRDPLASVTRQQYLYAGDDPLNAWDPTGLFTWRDLHTWAGYIGDVATLLPVAGAIGVGIYGGVLFAPLGLTALGVVAGAAIGWEIFANASSVIGLAADVTQLVADREILSQDAQIANCGPLTQAQVAQAQKDQEQYKEDWAFTGIDAASFGLGHVSSLAKLPAIKYLLNSITSFEVGKSLKELL